MNSIIFLERRLPLLYISKANNNSGPAFFGAPALHESLTAKRS